MIFLERKTIGGYQYECFDVFGDITLDATVQLTPDILDESVVALLKIGSSAGEINGTIEHEQGAIGYKFKRSSLWQEDEEQLCTNTLTSTKEQGNVCSQTRQSPLLGKMRKILSYPRRFALAFKESWQKTST